VHISRASASARPFQQLLLLNTFHHQSNNFHLYQNNDCALSIF
jgi:hypothetical protein